jgi:soluble lytic murein transglycosylase-like protein
MIAIRVLLLSACMVLPRLGMADIYGYVDESGVVHLSDAPLDERYFLFKKEVASPIEPPAIYANTPGERPVATQEAATPVELNGPYRELIGQVAREQGVDPALVHAVVAVESGFDARARSPKGAIGLMQLMPQTARRYGVSDIWNPLENLRAGTRYLRYLLGVFDQNVSLALAAYNAGEGAVIGAGHKIPPYPETRSYVPRVLKLWERARARM